MNYIFEDMLKLNRDITVNLTIVFSIIGCINYILYKYCDPYDTQITKDQQITKDTEITQNQQITKNTEITQAPEITQTPEITHEIENISTKLQKEQIDLIDIVDIRQLIDKKNKLIVLYDKLTAISSVLELVRTKIQRNN